jgi:hypothetical protein
MERYDSIRKILNDIKKKKRIIKTINVQSKTTKIKAKWTIEMAEDLGMYHSLDINAEFEKILLEELKKSKNENINKFFK